MDSKEKINISLGMDLLDKHKVALIKMFVPEFQSNGIPAYESLRSAYVQLTGDVDIRGRGTFIPENIATSLRACQGFTSSTFQYALQNALNMYLSKIYKEFPYYEDSLISDKKRVEDFRSIRSIQLGNLEDLPDIDPETGDLQELSTYVDTEMEYNIGQKGGLIYVTRMHIINDAIGLIQAMVKLMAKSARRTHAKYVWAFYMNNSNCPDGTAWFTEAHGNLGASALDYSPIVTAVKALANMTEGDSGEKIGMDLASFDWNLILPIDSWDLGVKKNQEEYYFSSNDLTSKVTNPCKGLFGDHNERIVTCPFLTDANDWGIIRNKEDVPIVEMSYLHGKEDPEFIIENGPLGEKALTSDKFGYKIRHEYGGALGDYKGGYKSVVA